MRFLASLALAGALLACNGIFGIDEATLDTSDAAPTGTTSAAASGAAEGGGVVDAACSLSAAGDPCNKCVAQRCCTQFDACLADPTCKLNLAAYDKCLGVSFTNDAGGTCDEDFATSGRSLDSELATCAFLNNAAATPPGCVEECKGRPVGNDICSTYCGCMDDTCPGKLGDAGECITVCGAFSERQLTCRPYHCGLAKNAKGTGDEPGRITHCGHAAGEALCP
jgi:hypothetical protein